jgi:hypothetical protein
MVGIGKNENEEVAKNKAVSDYSENLKDLTWKEFLDLFEDEKFTYFVKED